MDRCNENYRFMKKNIGKLVKTTSGIGKIIDIWVINNDDVGENDELLYKLNIPNLENDQNDIYHNLFEYDEIEILNKNLKVVK